MNKFFQFFDTLGNSLFDAGKWLGKNAGTAWNTITGKTELLEKEQAFNSAEAQKQRDWQEMMSNTAHQREVEDLKSSGLNPILSSGGSGSSTPTGSSASSNAGSPAGNIFSGIASVLSSAASLTNNRNIDRATTNQIYNSAGNLIKTVESYTRDL